MKITPLRDRVLVRQKIFEKKQKLLIVPNEMPQVFYEIVAIGESVTSVSIGDVVTIGRFTGCQIEFDEKLAIVEEKEIYAKIEGEMV